MSRKPARTAAAALIAAFVVGGLAAGGPPSAQQGASYGTTQVSPAPALADGAPPASPSDGGDTHWG
jgi:hypothetical protein